MLFVQLRSHKLKGRPASALITLFPELEGKGQAYLVFCHSGSCAPCRAMKPDVDALKEETNRVFKLDLSKHSHMALELGIRAVPTTLVIKDGVISQSVLGKKSKKDEIRNS